MLMEVPHTNFNCLNWPEYHDITLTLVFLSPVPSTYVAMLAFLGPTLISDQYRILNFCVLIVLWIVLTPWSRVFL